MKPPGCIQQNLLDMGFSRLTPAAKISSGNFMGKLVTLTCMYYVGDDVLNQDPQITQRTYQHISDEAFAVTKQAEDMAEGYSQKKMKKYWTDGDSGTAPPPFAGQGVVAGQTANEFGVDKYGTPNCGGWCTTMDMVYWNAWTEAPKPEAFL